MLSERHNELHCPSKLETIDCGLVFPARLAKAQGVCASARGLGTFGSERMRLQTSSTTSCFRSVNAEPPLGIVRSDAGKRKAEK